MQLRGPLRQQCWAKWWEGENTCRFVSRQNCDAHLASMNTSAMDGVGPSLPTPERAIRDKTKLEHRRTPRCSICVATPFARLCEVVGVRAASSPWQIDGGLYISEDQGPPISFTSQQDNPCSPVQRDLLRPISTLGSRTWPKAAGASHGNPRTPNAHI